MLCRYVLSLLLNLLNSMAHLDVGYVFGNGEAACLGKARQQNVQEGGHLGGHVDCHLRQREGKRRHLLDLALALAQELQEKTH
jgi:hypothetical protein